MTEEGKRGSWYRWPLAFVGTVFIGAIGNGVWEFFLRDFVNATFLHLANAYGSVSSTYFDSLHAQIGKAFLDEPGYHLFAIFVGVIVGFHFVAAFFLSFYRKHLLKPNTSRPRATHSIFAGKTFWVFMAMAMVNVVAYTGMLLTSTYRIRAIVWTERAIEIIHPHIAEPEFLALRAEFRSVDDAHKFYSLYTHLNSLAHKNKITLPEFEPIGLATPASNSH